MDTFYKKVKGRVGIVDELSSIYGITQNTKLWPIVCFTLVYVYKYVRKSFIVYQENYKRKISQGNFSEGLD